MRDSVDHIPYRVVIVTLDQHTAGPVARLAPKMAAEFPGLSVEVRRCNRSHTVTDTWTILPDNHAMATRDTRIAICHVSSTLLVNQIGRAHV